MLVEVNGLWSHGMTLLIWRRVASPASAAPAGRRSRCRRVAGRQSGRVPRPTPSASQDRSRAIRSRHTWSGTVTAYAALAFTS
jgi:hypothetical protein